MTKEFVLEDSIYRLLNQEPFYAELCLKIEKEASDSCESAGVGITDDGHFKLVYSKEWMSSLSQPWMKGLLRHELEHILYGHVTSRGPIASRGAKMTEQLTPEERAAHKRWNQACDLAINSNIPFDELPKPGTIPGYGDWVGFYPGFTAELYMKQLEDNPMEQEGFDDHSNWGFSDSSDLTDDQKSELLQVAEQNLRTIVQEAIEVAEVKGWGSVSQKQRKKLRQRFSNKLDWKGLLRYFIKTSVKSSKRSSYMKLNRKYPYFFPGRKIERKANIIVLDDQSGSVSDAMHAMFWAELSKLAGEVTFTFAPFDTEVAEKDIFVWKKGTAPPPRRVQRGGTNFQNPSDWAESKGFDGMIILTDMGAGRPTKTKTQRLWVTTENDYNNCRWTKELGDRFAVI